MLLEYKVKNYNSIKDELVLNLQANHASEHPENVILASDRPLKVIGIYGPNAAGKSSVVESLLVAIDFIGRSHLLQPTDLIFGVRPFKFDTNSINDPTEFEFSLVVDEVKYIYTFKVTMFKVVYESLIKYETAKPSLIFERHNDNYHFTSLTKPQLELAASKTGSNKLLLSVAATLGIKLILPVFTYLYTNVKVIAGGPIIHANIERYNLPDLKKNVLAFLKEADISIIDYEIKIINKPLTEKEKFFASNLPVHPTLRVTTIHAVTDLYGNTTNYELDFEEESLGTQKLFQVALALQDIFEGKVLVFDEIEASLHPHLVQYIIRQFHRDDKNNGTSQLIYTTHCDSTLDLDYLRRDQIYFIERDHKSLSTTLTRLSEFSPRKNEDIFKAYNNGRYGAVPFVSDHL